MEMCLVITEDFVGVSMAKSKKKDEWVDVNEDGVDNMYRYRAEFECFPNDLEEILEHIRGYGEVFKTEKRGIMEAINPNPKHKKVKLSAKERVPPAAGADL